MAGKHDLISYKKNINTALGKRNDGMLLDYDEAEKMVVKYITDKRLEDISNDKTKKEVKTKEDLRNEITKTRRYVTNCLLENNISVRDYQDEKVERFIEDMVQEYAGYSILDDAFYDDEISDIYCIAWDSIFVEKAGKNVKYWKKFRSKEHYRNVVERFIRTAGKEINNGENKIVDFELYQDRGCATCPVVSPRDYTMTLRKHAEDHIILDQLLEWQCMSEEMAEFFGNLLIDGEANWIYAGLTGSGKTTTMRALLDEYVTRNQRRMLICEDTQELFPKNEHTLELVSVKSDKKETAVSLSDLIVTALRLKPKYIIVGEVRAEEAMAAVEGMETGHSTAFSMHGGIPMNIVNRLVTKYLQAMPSLGIEVVERIVGCSIDYIAIQDNIPGIGRKCSMIHEVEYDFDKRTVKLTPIFEFDFEVKDFLLKNRIGPEKASKMMRRGVDQEYIKKWVRTNDPEVEKAAVKAFNDRYFAEKPARLEKYKKRKEEREAKKTHAAEELTPEQLQNKKMVQAVIMNENIKSQDRNMLIEKANNLTREQIEELEQADKEIKKGGK